MKTFNVALCLVLFTVGIFITPKVTVAQVASAADTASFVKLMTAEDAMNVGKTLPLGIAVVDRHGNISELRSLLHGPTTLLVIKGSCPPCEDMLSYIRTNAGTLTLTSKQQLVVLRIDDVQHASMNLPSAILELHTSSTNEDGFLAGKITPTAFFFDSNLKLINRRAGLVDSPEEALVPPIAR